MVTPLKTDDTLDYPLQTDVLSQRIIGRDHRSLLRSSPHRFKDGAWSEEDTQFHVYREIENPAVGSSKTSLFGPYWHRADPNFLTTDGSVEPFTWHPTIARGFDAPVKFDQPGDPVPLPTPTVTDYADYVLGLNALGTAYIRRFRPGNPVASLGQFYGELHDLPRLPIFLQRRTKKYKDLGSEYLNVEFGWKPFVKDLIKAYELQQTIELRLKKLRDGNNIRVKRRSKRELTSVTSDLCEGNLTLPFGDLTDPSIGGNPDVDELAGLHVVGPYGRYYEGSSLSGSCPYRAYNQTDTTVWYVGTYRYYVPDIGSDRWTEKAKAALFGLTPTPSVLYELYPWSWLADWFANVGDIFSNLSANAVDNEVLTDSYVMKSIVDGFAVEADPTWDASSYHAPHWGANLDITAGSEHLQYTLLKVQKMRRQASPFGFGLKTGDFTASQLAILAALGISQGKLPKKWRYLTSHHWY